MVGFVSHSPSCRFFRTARRLSVFRVPCGSCVSHVLVTLFLPNHFIWAFTTKSIAPKNFPFSGTGPHFGHLVSKRADFPHACSTPQLSGPFQRAVATLSCFLVVHSTFLGSPPFEEQAGRLPSARGPPRGFHTKAFVSRVNKLHGLATHYNPAIGFHPHQIRDINSDYYTPRLLPPRSQEVNLILSQSDSPPVRILCSNLQLV